MKMKYRKTGEGCLLENLVGPNPAFFFLIFFFNIKDLVRDESLQGLFCVVWP